MNCASCAKTPCYAMTMTPHGFIPEASPNTNSLALFYDTCCGHIVFCFSWLESSDSKFLLIKIDWKVCGGHLNRRIEGFSPQDSPQYAPFRRRGLCPVLSARHVNGKNLKESYWSMGPIVLESENISVYSTTVLTAPNYHLSSFFYVWSDTRSGKDGANLSWFTLE
jgi:hypothetical protein